MNAALWYVRIAACPSNGSRIHIMDFMGHLSCWLSYAHNTSTGSNSSADPFSSKEPEKFILLSVRFLLPVIMCPQTQTKQRERGDLHSHFSCLPFLPSPPWRATVALMLHILWPDVGVPPALGSRIHILSGVFLALVPEKTDRLICVQRVSSVVGGVSAWRRVPQWCWGWKKKKARLTSEEDDHRAVLPAGSFTEAFSVNRSAPLWSLFIWVSLSFKLSPTSRSISSCRPESTNRGKSIHTQIFSDNQTSPRVSSGLYMMD